MKIRVNDIETHYQLTGPESAPTVTFSNSLLANLSMWDLQLPALADFRVLRLDTRGHGQTEATPGAYDVELLAGDVIALLDALDIEKTHFVGLSLGGMIGQQLALECPDRLERLVLCDTRSHSPPSRSQSRAQRIATVQREGIEPLVQPALESWFSAKFRKANPDTVQAIADMIRTTSVDGLVGCTHAIDKQDHSARLTEIKSPTLVMVGEDDQSTPLNEAWELHERIDGSEMVVMPKARHLPNLECPDDFNAELLKFLSA